VTRQVLSVEHADPSAELVAVPADLLASTLMGSPWGPTAPGSFVLLSRRRGLTASAGTPPQSLPVLSNDEAVDLLVKVACPEREGAEPASAAEVVRRSGYQPPAIRLARARLARRPGWPLADLARRLGQESRPARFAAEDRSPGLRRCGHRSRWWCRA
jgi:hypothetical protein